MGSKKPNTGPQVNTEQITAEFCVGKALIFFPQSEEESEFIQRKIFALGYSWPNRKENVDLGVHGSFALVLTDYKRSRPTLLAIYRYEARHEKNVLLCTSDQFGEKYMSEYDFRASMTEKFNQMAERIEALTQTVAALQRELQPKVLDKAPLEKPTATKDNLK
jgi:hypothetical protein